MKRRCERINQRFESRKYIRITQETFVRIPVNVETHAALPRSPYAYDASVTSRATGQALSRFGRAHVARRMGRRRQGAGIAAWLQYQIVRAAITLLTLV